ncbi:hypothetical protein IFM89_030873 [Coptis chinensis]|uniref:Fibronectin type-III domain-containing protein n=1 Tax=Coptis chinensis TaxID=261450 RepID=A0A835IGL7_9MAGN|nr:hypothetical protein IFM89_030873 [Coptis chinensis]
MEMMKEENEHPVEGNNTNIGNLQKKRGRPKKVAKEKIDKKRNRVLNIAEEAQAEASSCELDMAKEDATDPSPDLVKIARNRRKGVPRRAATQWYVLDPSKCSKLSMDEKRQLIYEISKCPDAFPEMLRSWSRQELFQVLCAETGKEIKKTCLTKMKIIERLMRVVSKNKRTRKISDGPLLESKSLPIDSQTTIKRQRKSDNPSRVPIENTDHAIYCQNPACRAIADPENSVCKLCSCYICYQYDCDKDPSLWLFCISGPSHYEHDSCGMSCHVECALRHERAGSAENSQHGKLDGSFCCVSCGKLNDLHRCLRKQLLIAKDTRQMEVLFHRLSLSQTLLRGTKKYQKVHEIVSEAVRKLEAEVGPLPGLPMKLAEGNVSSLSTGPETQKLCASAMKLLDSLLPCSVLLPDSNRETQGSAGSSLVSSSLIRFENVCPSSITLVLGFKDTTMVGWYNLWHRTADTMNYPEEPTCTLFSPNSRFSFFNLIPSTEYIVKITKVCNMKEVGKWEVRFMTSSGGVNVGNSLVVQRGQSPSPNSSSLCNLSEGGESDSLSACGGKVDNSQGSSFCYCTKLEMPEKTKLSNGGNKDISESPNRSTDRRREETGEGSIFAADDECIIAMHNLKDNAFKGFTNLGEKNHASDEPPLNNNQPHPGQLVNEISTETGSNSPVTQGLDLVRLEYGSDGSLPSTPCGLQISKPDNFEVDSVSRKAEEPCGGRMLEKIIMGRDQECTTAGSFGEDYLHCVKVIRSLELKRYIEKNFREKFLSWYSLRATTEERRVIKVLVNTLMNEPMSLSGKLIKTFSERIFNKRPLVASSGFC